MRAIGFRLSCFTNFSLIPTVNAERLLPRCFDSLIPAAVRGVVREVIVADGGSSDATLTPEEQQALAAARTGSQKA